MDEARGVTGGPLAPYEDALRAELAATGYAGSSAADVVRTMDRLSVWLQGNGRTAADLTPTVVEKFLALRREHSSSEVAAEVWGRYCGFCVVSESYPVAVRCTAPIR